MNAFDSSVRTSFALRIALALSIAGLFALPVSRALAQDDATAPPAEAAPQEAAPDEAAPDEAAPDEAVPEQGAEAVPAEETSSEQGAADGAVTPDVATDSDAAAELDAPASEGEPAIADDIAAETAAATAPGAEEEATEEATEEAAPAPEPSPFRGSLFSWQHGLTVNTLDAAAQLSHDPTYYQSFFLQGRYYLDRQNFFVLSQGLSVELTDANYTTTLREPQLGDTSLEFRHIEVVEGFVFIPAVRVAAPLSTWSQAVDRVLNTGAGLTVVKVFPELASFTIAASGSYRHWFATATTSSFEGLDGEDICKRAGQAADELCGGLNSAERDRLTAALTLTVMPLPGLTVLTQYAFAWAYGYAVPNATLGSVTYVDDSNHWRNFHYWTLAVGYDVVPWLNLQVGYQSASFMTLTLNDDGSIRNPFYNPESEVFLSATLALDVFVDDVILGTEDEISPEQMQRRRQGLAGRTAVDTSF